MRINKYIALATGISRRAADTAVASERVRVNGSPVSAGYDVVSSDAVTLDDTLIAPPQKLQTILFHKPRGYVCSRNGQGSNTIYDILPASLHHLKPVGRLDKDSSGLLILTNDGTLANALTHPSQQKVKIYEVTLDKPLAPLHHQMIVDYGVQLADGPSKFSIQRIENYRAKREQPPDMAARGVLKDEIGQTPNAYQITMQEGRNRQIRRTFATLGYTVQTLHRTQFGPYTLGALPAGKYHAVES